MIRFRQFDVAASTTKNCFIKVILQSDAEYDYSEEWQIL